MDMLDPKEVFQHHYDALEDELHEAGIPTHRQSVRDLIASRADAAMRDTFADHADYLNQLRKDAF